MKKILVRIGIALVILIILAVLAISLFLDGAVKRSVETMGSKMAQVDVKLDKVSLSLFSGSGTVKGLVIGNPPNYKTAQAISVGSTTVGLKPGTLLSKKIVITKIEVVAPDITFEGGLTANNLGKIRSNLEGNTSSSAVSTNATAAKEETESKKLEVDDFLISNAKVHVALNGLAEETINVPEIHLTGLGTGPDGITGAELGKKVLAELEKQIIAEISSHAGDLKNLAKGLGKNGGTNLDQLGKGIGNFLKKK
jgi:uncharacterized protein involved in outer membrane biogenesis